MTTAMDIVLEGHIQGVGFRPFVWKLATSLGVTGWVQNTPQGVLVHGEASDSILRHFLHDILHNAPFPAHISAATNHVSSVQGFGDFQIQNSSNTGDYLGHMIPDLCLCDACKKELFDPNNSRFLHPFISCTQCGPRFSIIQSLPYDRPLTSMASFKMCPPCDKEYHDPNNRRFHAQPICCPNCGPQMWCEKPDTSKDAQWAKQDEHWLDQLVHHTMAGKISLLKGIGGFHLLCDALNANAVQSLRAQKHRESKPFAIMVPSIDVAKEYCHVSLDEESLLMSAARPIVLLDVHHPPSTMSLLAPELTQLGVMLPYTPVHELLFSKMHRPIVLTSANRNSEPMLKTNEEARTQGLEWCDLLILHDRDIVNRADDSVVAAIPDCKQRISLRLGRGSSPQEFVCPSARNCLAFGADLKNTIALAHHGRITLSQHIGDMDHPLTQQIARQSAERLCESYRVIPEILACDAHPDYFSSQVAELYSRETNTPLIQVAHHHAHLAAAWVEHQWDGPAIGFAMDGTGYGDAECIWGSEVMHYEHHQCKALGHIQSMRLPGGDRAVKEPARILLSALHDHAPAVLKQWLLTHPDHAMLYGNGIKDMLVSDLNSPSTRGMGRLFDCIGAMLGWANPTWDGEYGTRLENLDTESGINPWPFEIVNHQVLLSPILSQACSDVMHGASPWNISSRLHATVCEIIVQLGLDAERQLGTSDHARLPWVFSGGVFQNRKIHVRLNNHPQLRSRNCYFSSIPNDNGIALGQIIVASHLHA